MYQMSNETGVAIFFFNRPKYVKQVFERVAKAKPSKLFLIQDGPRSEKDIPLINECQEIFESIDWKCDVYKNYSETNLGCGKRMSSGITWVFENVERAILLEDDCVPHLDFFQFADELLEKYKDDERIMLISSMNHFGETKNIDGDYLFAYNGAIWGWATWKRAWDNYDYSVSAIKDENVIKFLKSGIQPKRVTKKDISHWKETNMKVENNEKISYWAHQWRLVKFLYNNLCIVPRFNLMNNVGDEGATHGSSYCKFHNMNTFNLEFPLKHPDKIYRNVEYDKKYYEDFYLSFKKKLILKIKLLLKIKK